MTCVSEGIISQLLVLLWMILKGTHGGLSEGGAPHPVLSCLAVCSCPSFLSLSFFLPLRKLSLGHFRGSYLPVLTAGPTAAWSWPRPGLTCAQSPAVPLLDSVPSAKLPAHAVGGVRGGLEPRTESESLGQGSYNPARETLSQFCETQILLNDIWSGCKEIS